MGNTAYTYDANGNMTTRGADAFTYDAENRLTQATVGGVVTQYAYNADGARVKRSDGTTTTYYVGNYFEVTQAGAVTKYYYFGARRVAMKQGSAVTYLHGDHLGSTSVASNANGALVARQTYYAYGAPRTSDGALPTDYTFTGQRADASAGLMFYNARYYDAALGRFISVDTLVADWYNPQLLNRFAYVRNNPVKHTDPTGHCDPDYCRWRRDENGGWVVEPKPPEPRRTITSIIQDLPGTPDDWSHISTGLDVLAWLGDLYAAGIVTYGGIAGAGVTSPAILAGAPQVPAATGLAGMAIAELAVQPLLQATNSLATASTVATVVSSTKSGQTVIEEGIVGLDVSDSAFTTTVGWMIPEAFTSLAIQSVTVTNDLGWTSFPFGWIKNIKW